MKPKVYVETSIPSFYFEERPEPQMVARREWTRQWWDNHRHEFDLWTSVVVIEELMEGDYPNKSNVNSLIGALPLLPYERKIDDIVQVYIDNLLMPRKTLGDAYHLAMSSFHACDFLLTWNCNHLANARKFAHIKQVNTRIGLFVPELVTPLELLGESVNER